MDRDVFWELIEESRPSKPGNQDEQLDNLKDLLRTLGDDQLVRFDQIMHELVDSANSWDLWGAAYIMNGGCSNDGFEYFRRWLISQGRSLFESSLASADSLASMDLTIDEDEGGEFESLAHVAQEVWEDKHEGARMPIEPSSTHSGETSGTPWDEDGDDLKLRFPRLFTKYGW